MSCCDWNEGPRIHQPDCPAYKGGGIGVTRFEVIDHRIDGKGRVFVAWPCSVELSIQDDGNTLKVFVHSSNE